MNIKNPPKGKSVKSLRYIGSMVADVHRVILYVGTFLVFLFFLKQIFY